jgi:hypothetical protein
MPTSTDLPSLPLSEWQETYGTLHMWTQIVGKIRLERTPLTNHWWNVTLYVTARGLTTSAMPWADGAFEIDFDFVDHALRVRTSAGATRYLALAPRAVADFYAELLAVLRGLGIEVPLYGTPMEVPDPIPFAADRRHASYDSAAVERFWRILLWSDGVLKEFRSRFIGKCSPVHFFWGSFDLAVTRFSGRRAPERPDADAMTREAYSHEVISAGFWPGGGPVTEPAYYCYAAPAPPGFEREPIRPTAGFYHQGLAEFLLPYEAVRSAASPRDTLLEFLQSTYEAGARLGGWDRAALERSITP